MSDDRKSERSRDWYSISLDSVRLWTVLFAWIVAILGIYLGVQWWLRFRLEQRAFEIVDKGGALMEQIQREKEFSSYQEAFARARGKLDQASTALDGGDHRGAVEVGEDGLLILQDIRDQIYYRGQAGIAWFISVEGDVQYRRGDSGQFLRAFPRGLLYEADYVRSGSGASAEIYFNHEDTRFTLRPNSLFKLTRTKSATNTPSIGYMEYGWVALDTAQTTSAVTTKYSEVTVGRYSRASVSQDESADDSVVRVNQGSASVRAVESGQIVELGERQEVTQSEGLFEGTRDLPPAPMPIDPPDNFHINIDSRQEVELEWSTVEGAARYALQVSRSRLFGENLIDAEDRLAARAKLGFRDEGSYMWRVAAIDQEQRLGPWSSPRMIRVSSFRGLDLEEDTEPPELEFEVLLNGNIAILRGNTEPGAGLDMNGEPIDVAADGTFATSRVLFGSGRVPLVFRVVDAAGNETVERQWVYLDEG